tara:strand:- start:181 stop:417 length:237 start_codon:yes stop_codon:yes gene_type:complete
MYQSNVSGISIVHTALHVHIIDRIAGGKKEKEHVVSISYLCNVKHQQVRAITITFKKKRKRKSGRQCEKNKHYHIIIT